MDKLFTDSEWDMRFNHHQIMMSDYGKTLESHVNFVFKLEARIKELEKGQGVLIDLVQKLGDRIK